MTLPPTARNRLFDMPPLLQRFPHLLGLGLDEDAALLVRGEAATVLGTSYVYH